MNLFRRLWRISQKWATNHLGVSALNYRNNTSIRNHELTDEIHRIRIDGMALQSFEELVNIARMAEATTGITGDVAEFGVYRGGSARLIAARLNSRILHLFDSFEGMVKTTEKDVHRPGDFNDTSLSDVRQYLKDHKDIRYHEGWFPETARGLEDLRFSFVHLDVDLYESTLEALKFFWPRLERGGMILCHDFNSISCPGVALAFREYCPSVNQPIIELAGTTQCLLVKSQGVVPE